MKWNVLIDLRERKNLFQKQMAQILQVPVKTYNNWELGLSKPKYEDLIKIADYFNVTTDYLLGREEQEKICLTRSEYETLLNAFSVLQTLKNKKK